MKVLKKILLFGLIGDFGGIAVEAHILAKVLVKSYKVNLVSTNRISSKSFAIIDHKNFSWYTVARSIYNQYLGIRVSSKLTKFIHGRREKPETFIGNKITHHLYDFNSLYLKSIEKAIIENDIVIFLGSFDSKWLKEIVAFSYNNKKPLIFRTTGTIRNVSADLVSAFQDEFCVLVHSKSNFKALRNNGIYESSIIDQTSLMEKELLSIDLESENSTVTFGYLGRFGKEKGILEFLDALNNSNNSIVFAGDGPFVNEVKHYCETNEKAIYLGKLTTSEIPLFFKKIDVLIVPSMEEAGPLVAIEAMAAGKLIISTKVGATQERLENTANQFWFDINKPETLHKAIIEIKSLPKKTLYHMKNEVRERYLLQYSNEIIFEQYSKVVSEILTKK